MATYEKNCKPVFQCSLDNFILNSAYLFSSSIYESLFFEITNIVTRDGYIQTYAVLYYYVHFVKLVFYFCDKSDNYNIPFIFYSCVIYKEINHVQKPQFAVFHVLLQ